MKLTVNMRGESLFTWEGDDAEINNLSAELGVIAAQAGHSDMVIGQSIIREVGQSGLPAEEPGIRQGSVIFSAMLEAFIYADPAQEADADARGFKPTRSSPDGWRAGSVAP